MNINHQVIGPSKENPFGHDKLDRKQYADVLSGLISTYKNGFVMSINGQWGTGKTTFVKMWEQKLISDGHNTIYFNAWENDFESNPLVALMGELGKLTKSNDKTFKSLVEKAAIIGKSVVPALMKAFVAKYINQEVLIDAIENATEGAMDIFKDEVSEYAQKKESLQEFRTELQKYVETHVEKKPLILFIDELDRCRPNYALELLEKIKHLFNVPGIVFILSIDKTQLGNAIKGAYGSEQIDSTEYLRRFIDLEFILPAPDTEKFCAHLYSYYDFKSQFERLYGNRIAYTLLGEPFLRFSIHLFSESQLTLRQQEKIFLRAKIVLSLLAESYPISPVLFLYLIFIREFHPLFYNRLRAINERPQLILDDFKATLPVSESLTEDAYHLYLDLEVSLIVTYDKDYRHKYQSIPIITMRGEQYTVNIKPTFDKEANYKAFAITYQRLQRNSIGVNGKISEILKRIDLLESFDTTK